MADTETDSKQTPAPYVPPSQRDIEELSKALADEGVIEKPVTQAAPVAPAPPETAKAEEELPAITRIAKKQAEFRKEVEPYKPVLDLLLKAKNKQITPSDALAALGYTHSEYVESVLGKQAPADEPEAPVKAATSRDPEIEELRRFKAQYEAEKAQQTRAQALQGIEAAVKKGGDKFKHLATLERWDMVEQVIINYHAQNGALPGDTFEESVALAAEVVEGQLKQESTKWAKLYGGGLTSQPTPATVPNQKAPESPPSTGTETARTLTNSNTAAPAAVRSVPKTREERIAALIEGREDELA